MPSALPVPPPSSRSFPRYRRWAIWLIPAFVFAVLAPVVPTVEFSNGIEELHVATVLDIRRGGPWLVPTLNGKPRLAKPPMPAWIGATFASDAAMAGVASADPATRAAGYARLAWDIRWPTLLLGCLMLVATADLGTTLGNRRVGLAAAAVAGSSLLFLSYARYASTDIHLMLWVAVANALLARAIFRRQVWLGAVGAGAAIGLGMMSKGPVVLVQTVVPILAWWAASRLVRRRARTPICQRAGRRSWALPLSLGVVAFLVVALPWPIAVLRSMPGVVHLWRAEITREGATDHDVDPIWTYLSLLPNLLPWLPAFVVGVWMTVRGRSLGPSASVIANVILRYSERSRAGGTRVSSPRSFGVPHDDEAATSEPPSLVPPIVLTRRRHARYVLAAFLLIAPIVVMSAVRDKYDRYLLPMLPAAAILTARGLVAVAARVRQGRPGAIVWLAVPLSLVAAMAVLVPVAGMIPSSVFRQVDGRAWYRPAEGLAALAIAVAASAGLYALARRRPDRAIALAAATMVLLGAFVLVGYKDSAGGRDEMKPIAEQIHALRPGATVAYYDPSRSPKPIPPDLPIYLNRQVEVLKRDAAATRPTAGAAGPDVIVMLQREEAPAPKLDGWRLLAKTPYKARWWHALVRAGGE